MAKKAYIGVQKFIPRNIPNGYTQVEYIESSGTQYIDTMFVPNQDTRVVMEVEHTVTYEVSWLFGVRTAGGKNTFAFLAYLDKYRTDYNTTTSSYYDTSITAMTHVDKNKNITTLNSTEVITQTYAAFNCQYPLLLLAMNTAGTASGFASVKLRSVLIYDNGTLVRDFVPCRRDSDREVGLYDMVNGVFYGNAGTGIFTCPEPPMDLPQGYTQVAYIESSGTQCINTGFKPNQDTRVVVDIQVVSFDGYAPLFGARVASKNAEYATWAIAETDIKDGYGTQAENKLVAEALKRNIIDKNKNMLYVGGVLLKTHTAQTFAPNYPIFLFNINTAGSTTGSFKTFAKLYSCQIYDNATLVRDYVSCINPSGEAGLYDIVNGVFYGNAGTGSFAVGAVYQSDVARKIKRDYIGIDDVARRVKKAYIGIGDVARPCWSGGKLEYFGTATALGEVRAGIIATTAGNKALFAGGFGSDEASARVEVYDTSLTRTDATELSIANQSIGATTLNRMAIFAGGYAKVGSSMTGVGYVDVYDASLTKTTATALSENRYGMGATTLNGLAIFAGGNRTASQSASSQSTKVDVYNASLTRTTASSLSQARYNLAATTVGGNALFAGGCYSSYGTNVVDAYDASLTRTTAPSLSQGREWHCATTVGDKALFAGGLYGATAYNVVDVYDASLTKTTATSLSSARYQIGAVTISDYALFAGGFNGTKRLSAVDVYDASLTKTTATSLSQARNAMGAATISDYAIFAGGYDNSGGKLAVVDVYTVG